MMKSWSKPYLCDRVTQLIKIFTSFENAAGPDFVWIKHEYFAAQKRVDKPWIKTSSFLSTP